MAYEVIVFETVSGRIVMRDLPYEGQLSLSREINQPGQLSFSVIIGDVSVPATQTLRGIFTPWRFSAGIVWDGYITQAGPIITSQYDDEADRLSVTCGGLWRLLDRRVVRNPAAPLSPTNGGVLDMTGAADMSYTSKSLHTIAKKLVQDSCTRTPGFSLPITYPADIAGSSTRLYPVYDLATVGGRLAELTQVENGPDVDFAPYLDSAAPGFVRWEMRIGNPTLQQTGLDLAWDYGTGLRAVNADSDGSEMATGVFVKGNGTELSSLVTYQANTALVTAGWPATELVDIRSSVSDIATLQGYANGGVALHQAPVELWSVSVRADIVPKLGEYLPGTYAKFNLIGHPWIPDGVYLQRILGFAAGGSSEDVTLVLQASEGRI